MKNLFVIFIIYSNSCFAGWHSLGAGANLPVYTIYIDTISNYLYASGQFSLVDSIPTHGISFWNGSNWDLLAGGDAYSDYMNAIIRYRNKIYSDGRFVAGQSYNYGGIFDGQAWNVNSLILNGPIFKFKIHDSLLWVGGYFNKTGNDSCSMLSTWDGQSWNCVSVPYTNELDDFEFYDHKLFIGGNFFDSSGNNIDIAVFDSSTSVWSPLGGGILGGVSAVHAIQVYKNEIYVAGYFLSSAGNAGNHIMRWDGSNWNDVGGGTNDEIYCMKVYDNELYIGGGFTQAGNVPVQGLAKWNGNQWLSVTNSVFYPGIIKDMQFWNGELYVGGYFWTIDGITVNNIARYDGLSEIDENPSINFSISPNPSANHITVQFSSSMPVNAYLKIIDMLGRERKLFSITPDIARKEIDISELMAGVYLLVLDENHTKEIKKLIVE